MDDYDRGFADGLAAAVTLVRSGCSPEDLAALLPADPGALDPRAYSDRLGELRTILGTGFGVLGGADDA